MRRLITAMTGVLLLAGCSNFQDLFSAHANVAASAGPAKLTAERLGSIMAGAKGMKASREAGEYVAGVWVDYSLFAQAVARGQVLNDSSTIATAMWPEITETRANHWHDTLVARRGSVGPNAADSLYNGNDVRVFQHILIRVSPNATPEEQAKARKQAEAALARVKSGTDFGKVAQQVSQDGSAQDQGFLPPSRRGQMVAAFDTVAWKLAPGQVSGIVMSPFGFHIIRRPPEAAVRDRLIQYVQASASTELDSAYLSGLATAHKVDIKKDAPANMRNAAADPAASAHSTTVLASWEGGRLTVADFLRWASVGGPQLLGQVAQAKDDQLTNFARVLSQNVLLLGQADSAKIQLAPEEWAGMQQAYRGQLDTLKMDMGLGQDVSDTTAPEAQRLKVAEMKVHDYFDALVAGKTTLRPLPATLGAVLRERGQYKINQAGVDRAVQLAMAKKAQADSANGPTNPGQRLRPAPGPAPVPGAAPGQAAPGQTAPGQAAPGSAPAGSGSNPGQ